jgi:hypothetical protein
MSALVSSRVHAAPPPEVDGVWRGSALAQQQQATISSGDAALDSELPGQGWPLGQLT